MRLRAHRVDLNSVVIHIPTSAHTRGHQISEEDYQWKWYKRVLLDVKIFEPSVPCKNGVENNKETGN